MTSPESNQRPIDRKQAELLRRQERNKKQDDISPTMSRGSFLRLGASALGVAAAAGLGIQKWLSGEHASLPLPEPSATTVEERQKEYAALAERMDTVHESLQLRMQDFRRKIESQSRALGSRLTSYLLDPIGLFEFNERNPQKNYYRFMTDDLLKQGQHAFDTERRIAISDIRYFFYGFIDHRAHEDHFAAMYSPSSRKLTLGQDFERESVVDGLVAYHELVHVVQDTRLRLAMKSKEDETAYYDYLRAASTPPRRINILYEHDAYWRELLLTNIVTEGRFARAAEEKTLVAKDYEAVLGATSANDKETVAVLAMFGKNFFANGLPTEPSRRAVADQVTAMYQARGFVTESWRSIQELRKQADSQ